jgi:hypothetical protein
MPITTILRDQIPITSDLTDAATTPEESLLANNVGQAIEAQLSEMAGAGSTAAQELCTARSIAFAATPDEAQAE